MRAASIPQVHIHPGSIASPFNAELAGLVQGCFASRLHARDRRLFGDAEAIRKVIAHRLGWVNGPTWLEAQVPELLEFGVQMREQGFAHVLLLGMGGSSLCPEVLASLFPLPAHLKSFHIVDTTDPVALRRIEAGVDLSRTLFIVASKSGSTIETQSQLHYFFDRLKASDMNAGAHFVAITDAGSELERFAGEHSFARVFLNPGDIGGRYSALSYFGTVPAAMLNVPLADLAACALGMETTLTADDESNPGLNVGALLGAGARNGFDKLTFVTSASLAPVVPWIEQLVAESTGKSGTGIIPIEAEPEGKLDDYGDDRLFCVMRTTADPASLGPLHAALRNSGRPWLEIECPDVQNIAALFLLWEWITAAAGRILDINPFDEPNVKESKENTARLIGSFQTSKRFEYPAAKASTTHFEIASESVAGMDVDCLLASLLQGVEDRDYLAFLYFGDRIPAAEAALQSMRAAARTAIGAATLRGYGPRYLHSIGQLYKGGPLRGHFVVLLSPNSHPLDVPGSSFGFGELLAAQALGDYQALVARDRPCLWVRLLSDAEPSLAAFASAWRTACSRLAVGA